MDGASGQNRVARPEASWVQVTFLVPVRDSAPGNSLPWKNSPTEFALVNEPGKMTTEDWRARFIAAEVRPVLYQQRTSTVLAPPVELAALARSGETVTLAAGHLEFLPTGIKAGFGPGGILVVHAALHDPAGEPLPVRWLASAIKDLTRPPAGGTAEVAQFARQWVLSLSLDSDIRIAVNLVWKESTARELRPAAADLPWDAMRSWAWALARGTVPAQGALRSPARPASPGHTVPLQERIAVIDRSGAAVVSTRGDDSDANVGRTLAEAVPVFQSVYTDVFLLGYLGMLVAEEVGARLDALEDAARQPRVFHDIELRARFLSKRFWRTRVTIWPWTNDIFAAVLRENDILDSIEQLGVNIRDSGDQVERSFQHGLNTIILLLGLLGFVGVAAGIFGCVAAFLAVFNTGHWGANVALAGTSAGVVALAGGASLLLRGRVWRELSQYLRR